MEEYPNIYVENNDPVEKNKKTKLRKKTIIVKGLAEPLRGLAKPRSSNDETELRSVKSP